MKAWLIYKEEDVKKNQGYINSYIEEGEMLGITIRLVLAEELEFGVFNNQLSLIYKDNIINVKETLDFVICRTIYPLLSKQLEMMGVRVYNNAKVARICNDKAMTYQYVSKAGVTMVDSIFCKNEFIKYRITDDKSNVIVKAVAGHGGNQVVLLEHPTEEGVQKMKEIMGPEDVVIQPLTGSKHQDLRVYVIGKKIIAAILRTAVTGFKSNFSLGGEVSVYQLKEEEIKVVERIIDLFDFGLVGIDFIIGDQGELIFNEIEDVVGARMLYQCTDINIVNLYLKYILEDMKL